MTKKVGRAKRSEAAHSLDHDPDSWDCIDCGKDTAPGSNYRFLKSLGVPFTQTCFGTGVTIRGGLKSVRV
jgi:hypothetical protein